MLVKLAGLAVLLDGLGGLLGGVARLVDELVGLWTVLVAPFSESPAILGEAGP